MAVADMIKSGELQVRNLLSDEIVLAGSDILSCTARHRNLVLISDLWPGDIPINRGLVQGTLIISPWKQDR